MTGSSRALLVAALLGAATPSPAVDGDASGITALARHHDGLPNRVVVAGTVAYLALDTGLATVDVSNPGAPRTLGHLYLPSRALDVAVDGTHAFVANDELGLQVVDASDPQSPRWIGSLSGAGTRAVAVRGGVAYLAEASRPEVGVFGLRTADVSNPSSPTPLGFLPLPAPALAVAVTGSAALVGVGQPVSGPGYGLYAVDVSDPANPTLVPGAFLDLGLPVNDIAVAGATAYLAAGFPSAGALVVVDVPSPATLGRIAQVAIADGARGIDVAAGRVAVAARSLGLLVYDVAEPAAPRLLDSLPTGRETVAVALAGDMAFLGERASIEQAALTAVDALDPTALAVRGALPYAEATDAATWPGLVFLLRRDALHILTADDPGGPQPLATWRPPRGDFHTLAVNGALAAIGEGKTIHLVDVADPQNPIERGTTSVSLGVVVRLRLAGNTLYAVTGAGLETFDVSSPAQPAALGTLPTTGWASALAVDGSLGYLAAGPTLHVLDLSAPTLPWEITSLTLADEQIYGLDADGEMLVLTGLRNHLYVIDVTDPQNPELRSFLAGATGFDIRLSYPSALVAVGEDGVVAVDLNDPSLPREIGFYDTSGTAAAVAVEAGRVHVATVEAQHWTMECAACQSACIESWPTVAANSLRVVKVPVRDTFSWQVSASSGAFNLHATTVKSDLPGLAGLGATVAGFTASTTLSEPSEPPPGGAYYYRVFGRGSCTGESHP